MPARPYPTLAQAARIWARLSFGGPAGQQHAEVQRVQEPLFAQPALFLDQDAVHQLSLIHI